MYTEMVAVTLRLTFVTTRCEDSILPEIAPPTKLDAVWLPSGLLSYEQRHAHGSAAAPLMFSSARIAAFRSHMAYNRRQQAVEVSKVC